MTDYEIKVYKISATSKEDAEKQFKQYGEMLQPIKTCIPNCTEENFSLFYSLAKTITNEDVDAYLDEWEEFWFTIKDYTSDKNDQQYLIIKIALLP